MAVSLFDIMGHLLDNNIETTLEKERLVTKPRYQWSFVGSRFANLPWKDYDIIDTLEDKVVESHNSPFIVRNRLRILNALNK